MNKTSHCILCPLPDIPDRLCSPHFFQLLRILSRVSGTAGNPVSPKPLSHSRSSLIPSHSWWVFISSDSQTKLGLATSTSGHRLCSVHVAKLKRRKLRGRCLHLPRGLPSIITRARGAPSPADAMRAPRWGIRGLAVEGQEQLALGWRLARSPALGHVSPAGGRSPGLATRGRTSLPRSAHLTAQWRGCPDPWRRRRSRTPRSARLSARRRPVSRLV